MKVIIAKDYEEMSKKAFEVMAEVVKTNPRAVLGLATGSTPLGLYKNMIEDHEKNGTSYRQIHTAPQPFRSSRYRPRKHEYRKRKGGGPAGGVRAL